MISINKLTLLVSDVPPPQNVVRTKEETEAAQDLLELRVRELERERTELKQVVQAERTARKIDRLQIERQLDRMVSQKRAERQAIKKAEGERGLFVRVFWHFHATTSSTLTPLMRLPQPRRKPRPRKCKRLKN